MEVFKSVRSRQFFQFLSKKCVILWSNYQDLPSNLLHILTYQILKKRKSNKNYVIFFSSVQFSHSVVSDSLRPQESQHARPACRSRTPGVLSDSRPLSRWCHPATSSSVVPFSSCPQSLPALESFPMSQLIAWCGQSTGVWALASFLPKKSQGWSPSEWTGWISLQSKGLKSLLQHHVIFLFGRSHWIMKRV